MNKFVNFRIVFNVTSRNLYILSAFLVSCVPVALIYSEPVTPFLDSALIAFIFGILSQRLTYRENRQYNLRRREAFVIVTFSWLIICLMGSLPYIISGAIPSFVDSIFESVSGFTTTGSSILSDIESLPKSILFWRSLTHWIGGIGIIVLVIVIMPTLGMGGFHLFTNESSLSEKMRPRVASVGKRLVIIYVALTFSEVIFLLFGGMSLFDSLCHSFGTIATGGFSTKNDSLVSFSPYIQYVVMIFMFLSGTNFVIHYYIVTKQFWKIKNNEELWFYVKIVLTIGFILTFALFFVAHKPFEESFREAFFQLVSIITCTGFATADYLNWPGFALLIIFYTMFLGGCRGSTAGGIKMSRHLLLIKSIKKSMRDIFSPKAILPTRLSGEGIDGEQKNKALNFVQLYMMVFAVSSLILIAMNVDIASATSAVATCMGGIGPGMGQVGPMGNFAGLSDPVKIILSLVMLLGRLELYPILILFTRSFWKV